MITAITTFKLPKPMSLDEARQIFISTAPKYRDVPGLLRKYYIRSEDGGTAGGVYLWRTRADADALYTESWKQFVQAKYGVAPVIAFMDSPVIVDNVSDELFVDS